MKINKYPRQTKIMHVSDFDQVCGRLHGLIRACISDSLAFNFDVLFSSHGLLKK